MPASAEKQIKKQGGTARYRTLKKGDKTFTCAVTKKAGPKGGRTVCWPKEALVARATACLLEDDAIADDFGAEELLNSVPEMPDELVRSALVTLLWVGTDDDGAPLDGNYSVDDFDPESVEKVRQRALDFWSRAWKYLQNCDISHAAHDMVLSGGRHGTGFWDDDGEHYAEEDCRILDELAKKHFGEPYVFASEGMLYVERG